jgi:molybdopterin-binding protein
VTAPSYRLADAAQVLGVSDDTIRRWVDAGRIAADGTTRPRTIAGAELARVALELASAADGRDGPGHATSARNRFPGIVTRVERDGVMAVVELQAGPHRVVSIMTRESADDLGLEPGVAAAAVVKSTNVVVELP